MKKTILAILLLSQAAIAAKIPVDFDCYLPSDQLQCQDIKSGFFSSNTGFGSSSTEPKLSIKLRRVQLTDMTEYTAEMKGADIIMNIPYRLSDTTLSASEKLEKLLKSLTDQVNFLKPILGYQGSEQDKPFFVNGRTEFNNNKNSQQTSRWAVAELTGNYSTDRWRVQAEVGGFTQYTKTKGNAFSPGVKEQVIQFWENGGVIRSLNKHWDIMIGVGRYDVNTNITLEKPDPSLPAEALKNTATKVRLSLGTEWVLYPILKDGNNGNFAARYTLVPQHHEYIDPVSFQPVREDFVRHNVEVLGTGHFKKFDVGLSGSAYATTFRDKQFKGVSTTGSTSYRVNDRLTVTGKASVEYAKNRIPSPAEGFMSFSALTSGSNTDGWSYSGGFSVKYTLGNSRLSNSDQRWKKPGE